VVLTFFQDGAYGLYKTIVPYREDVEVGEGRASKVFYENQNGFLVKVKAHHRWFSYFRDL